MHNIKARKAILIGRERTGRRRQKGAVLVLGLLITTVLAIVAVNSAKSTIVQERMANNYRFSIEAMTNAENGSIRALQLINDQQLILNGFDDELDLDGNGEIDDRFELAIADGGNNVYATVVVVDDDDGDGDPSQDSNGVVLLMSQGISSNGTTSTTEVRIADTPGGIGAPIALDKAILTEQDLQISGNPEQFGSNQDIHSNANVVVSGSPITGGAISAVGDVTVNGGAVENVGSVESGVGGVEIPRIEPSRYASFADYIFNSDGSIYNDDGQFMANAFGSNWRGWTFIGDRWTNVGNNSQDGMLYFTGIFGNVTVNGSPGSPNQPWEISLLADGWIDIAGTPTITNYVDPDDPPEVQALQFLAGSDIKINGNSTQTFEGIIAAGEQVQLNGDANLEGVVIAAGESNESDLVVDNMISGNMSITYNDDLAFLPGDGWGDGIAVVLSWRDRQVARNAGVFAATAPVQE